MASANASSDQRARGAPLPKGPSGIKANEGLRRIGVSKNVTEVCNPTVRNFDRCGN